jgi:hypothetical protein
MKSYLKYLFLFVPGFIFGQVSFEAITNAESVLQGSTFQVTFQLKNAESSGFRAPDFSPFKVVSGPSRSMQTTIINGAMSSSVGFVYVLTCNQTGNFTIPPASVVVKGKTLQTRPIVIKVVKATPSSTNSADVFIKAIVEKQEVYYGEQFILTYKLYTRVNIDNIEFASKPNLDAFQEEAVNLNSSPVQREIYDGREYTTKVLSKSVLFPVKTGNLVIDPVVFRIAKGDNDPWGMGMPSLFRSQVENVVSNEIKLKVKDLPQPVPKHFSGAVGEMYIQVNSLNNSYTLNDAIHLGIELRGDANFNMIKTDFLQLDTSFEISDSRSGEIIKVTDEPKMTKTRKFDFLIVPKSIGEFMIKPGFVYFSPAQSKYISLQDSFPVRISKGNAMVAAKVGSGLADIKREIQLQYNSAVLWKDYKVWMLCCLPLGLLVIGFLQRNATYFSGGKNSKFNKHNVSVQNDLSVDHIENLVIQKINSKYSLQPDLTTLLSVKQFLVRNKSSDDSSALWLEIIYQLETLKYSGSASESLLSALKEKIEVLA